MKRKIAVFMTGLMMGCALMGNNFCMISYAATAAPGASIQTTDTIETKYRLYNGKIQYRRWNATKGKWVDPHWITVS